MSRLFAFVGAYAAGPADGRGGVTVVEVAPDGSSLAVSSHAEEPKEAGYLAYAPATRTLYAVDERKTDGRGPVNPRAAVHALRVDPGSGELSPVNSMVAPAPRPTYLSVDAATGSLLCANHGDFEHVEQVRRGSDGSWSVEYLYDDSSVILFGLHGDGSIAGIRDLVVFDGHGPDPNTSPQNGGHAQASSHAHCAVLDPSGRYVVVCDKGTDLITVFEIGMTLSVRHRLQVPPSSGPRHLVFSQDGERAYATFEFSSELASFAFDSGSGRLTLLDRVSTVEGEVQNEPADVRIAPASGLVYVNNRGEDSLAWFSAGVEGRLTRVGAVPLARSVHPGLAARSFSFDPEGRFVLVADRPANLVRSYRVSAEGILDPIAELSIPDPAFVLIVDLDTQL